MNLTIAEAAKETGLSSHTLRYYEKEGLFPFLTRDNNGNRIFKEDDLKWLQTINCLKNTGMPLKKIKEYIDLSLHSDDTLKARLEIIKSHQEIVEEKMNELKGYMDYIEYKIGWFEDKINSTNPKY